MQPQIAWSETKSALISISDQSAWTRVNGLLFCCQNKIPFILLILKSDLIITTQDTLGENPTKVTFPLQINASGKKVCIKRKAVQGLAISAH